MVQTSFGHKAESLTTALSYQKFAVKRKIPEVDADFRSRLTVIETQIQKLKKQKKKSQDEEFKDLDYEPTRVTLWSGTLPKAAAYSRKG